MQVFEWQSLQELSYKSLEIERFIYRVFITADNQPYDEDFTDFPVLVRLDGSNDVSMHRLDPVPLLRFYSEDLNQELAFEVDHWDPGYECTVWVKLPHISALSNSSGFYMYYGYDSPDYLEAHNRDVWSDHFLGVWHLNETGGTIYRDSSAGARHAALTGNTVSYTAPVPATGKIGGAQHWVESTTGIAAPPLSSTDLGPFTVSLWTYLDDLSASHGSRLFAKSWEGYQGGFHTRIDSKDIQYEIMADTGDVADNRALTIHGVVGEGS
jgi:hypothetical protein